MPIEIRGPVNTLDELRLFLSDQLVRSLYKVGPKFSSVDSGVATTYLKKDLIVSVHMGEPDEQGQCVLYMESEQKIPELEQIWDDAIIKYGKEIFKRLRRYSIKKDRVDRELKQR